jgi:ABC-type Fe3+/spermidine/putrescine transport system ATPase subunit
MSIRPERIRIVPADDRGPNTVQAKVDRTVYAGPVLNLLVQIDDLNDIQVSVANEGHIATYRHGEPIRLHMPSEAIMVLDRDEE